MTASRIQLEMNRALALCVLIASVILGLVEVVVGPLLQVTDISPPRIIWAFAIAAWAFGESRRSHPNLLPLLLISGAVTAVGSLVSPFVDAFNWYDEYTAYGILVAIAILSTVAAPTRRWLRPVVWLVPALWAFLFGTLGGRSLDAVLDWTIVAGATVAILHYVVIRLLESATAAAEAQDDLVSLHRALSRCSQVLLKDSSDAALDEALGALLEATAADYACVDRTIYRDGEAPRFQIVAEAAAAPLPAGADWMEGSYADLPTFLAAHMAGEVCAVRRQDLAGEERRLYERDGIEAELSVPIMVDGLWRGSLAFAHFNATRHWTALELDVLVQAASLVAAYWKRGDDHARLEQVIRSKDDLIASVSHELRTPLTAVVGLAGEMAASASEFDSETLGELARVVADQSQELADLVEDLLVAARVESGRLAIRVGEVALLTEARSIVESVAGGRDVKTGGSEALAAADPLRCRQIIRNLVTNAIRYGGEAVAVTVGAEGEMVVLTVSDDGEGVAESDSERIFQAYVRSQSVAPGSVGIGLAVSRNLAHLMGGTLEYRRRANRTEFRLSLPRLSQVGTPDPATEALLAAH